MFGPEDYEINLCAKACRQEADMVPAQNEQYENFIVRYKQNRLPFVCISEKRENKNQQYLGSDGGRKIFGQDSFWKRIHTG